MKLYLKLTAFLGATALFACSAKDVAYNYPSNPDYARKGRATSFLEEKDLVIFGSSSLQKKSVAAPIALKDSAIWKGALSAAYEISSISSIDEDAGLIVTSWKLESAALRSKINVIIKGVETKKQNLQILIFWQKKQGANWVNSNFADSEKGDLEALQIQEKIWQEKISVRTK